MYPSHPCRGCGVPVYTGDDWTYCSGGFRICYNNNPATPSKSLRDAERAGLLIVCAVGPNKGRAVVYDCGPSGLHPRPWRIPGTAFRYSGKQCLALPQPPEPEEPSASFRGFLARILRRT